MQILPGEQSHSDITPDVLALDETALSAVVDPWERARLAAELAAHLHQRSLAVLAVRRGAVHELVVKLGTAPSRVARFLGLTPTRVSQLVTAAVKGGEAR